MEAMPTALLEELGDLILLLLERLDGCVRVVSLREANALICRVIHRVETLEEGEAIDEVNSETGVRTKLKREGSGPKS